jgi:Fur family zinc uptake transcriptional regulator
MAEPTRGRPHAERHDHDHQHCVSQALARADALCERQGAKLTATRRRVLELVWGSHEPIGAYDILERLSASGRRAAPPTVYRALDFLLVQGLIHRIESRNAFVGCAEPDAPHSGQFLLCTTCGNAQEIVDAGIQDAVRSTTGRVGFRADRVTIEVGGVCARCQAAAEALPTRAGDRDRSERRTRA